MSIDGYEECKGRFVYIYSVTHLISIYLQVIRTTFLLRSLFFHVRLPLGLEMQTEENTKAIFIRVLTFSAAKLRSTYEAYRLFSTDLTSVDVTFSPSSVTIVEARLDCEQNNET